MQAGPTYLKQCPECGKYYSQSTLHSGNTGGTTYWTDGKMDAPMFPQYPDIIECVDCSTIFLISKQPEIDVRTDYRPSFERLIKYAEKLKEENNLDKESKGDHKGWEGAKSLGLHRTSAETYLKCLDTDYLNENGIYTEKKLRILAWRRFNDRFRDKEKPAPIEWTPEFRENAVRLIKLLDETDTSEAIMMKAEIYREMGEFDKSIKLLENFLSDTDSIMIKKLFALSGQGNSELVVINNL